MTSHWIDYSTCYVATVAQRSDEWHRLRTGALTGSIAAEWGGVIKTNLNDLARRVCGLSTVTVNRAMRNGTLAEPIIRDWYASHIKTPIEEVGMGIWKTNPIFRASPDGLVTLNGIDLVVEIKAPQKLYRQLISHVGSVSRGYSSPYNTSSHIFPSHYAQMTVTCAIFGRDFCDYVVAGLENGQAYCERVRFNSEHWDRLRDHGEQFYESYVNPCLEENGLARFDPIKVVKSSSLE